MIESGRFTSSDTTTRPTTGQPKNIGNDFEEIAITLPQNQHNTALCFFDSFFGLLTIKF